MYGLLLQSAADHLKSKYGEETWERIRREINISLNGFATHMIYSETLMVAMANAASKITGDTVDTIMDSFGVEFVNFVGQFGYDRILKVLGRHMRDFLNGLDNLHEYLRFSYPKLKPPSFFVEDETKNGLTLTYRSRRRGFLHYVKGQIRQVGRVFYHTRVDIFVVANDYNDLTQTTHVKFRLLFDNKAFREISNHVVDNIVDSIPLRPELLFELFPFHIVFSRKMEIRSVGPGLRAVVPKAVGTCLTRLFNLERPLTNFAWEDILHHTNNVFQIVLREPISRSVELIDSSSQATDLKQVDTGQESSDEKVETINQDGHTNSMLHLKGQMMYMNEWDSIMFLGTPIMSSLDDMFKIGLYINDLSMHDSSRDLVLAGTQQSAELKLALDQEQEKSRLLEQSMIKLDQEMQRTDALLYQMIPKPVADRLRKGVPSVETCQVFEHVTILFSDVVGFTTICSQITPMEVVSMLNAMYTQFDQLSERHSVYKVETIGDAYMAVSGAPTTTKYHALHMCDMALDMRASTNSLVNPSNQETMKIRIGVHTGTTVAGVVGIKMPRYCLFGDTVNTASRMETSGEAMKIHISETTRAELNGYPYEVQERGSIEVKGKGKMKTYWLLSRIPIPEADQAKFPFIAEMAEEVRNRNRDEQIENHNSRFNLDSGMPLSGSPIPYSPVSFKDVLEDRASPGGRKYSRGSRGSADGEALRMGATATPRGSRASLPGCPFALGLLSSSYSRDSQVKSPERHPVGKKYSIDLTHPPGSLGHGAHPSCHNPVSNHNSAPGVCPFTSLLLSKETRPSSKLVNESAPSCDCSNSQRETRASFSEDPVSKPTLSQQTNAPKSVGFGVSDSGSELSSSSSTTSATPMAADTDVPALFPHAKFENASPTNGENGGQRDGGELPAFLHQKNSPDQGEKMLGGNVIKGLKDIPAAPRLSPPCVTAQAQTSDKHEQVVSPHARPSAHSTGNGSVGHKMAPADLKQPHSKAPASEKRDSLINGSHGVKNEQGCLAASGCHKHKLHKKSKTCTML